jgi:hypothetical protein
VGKIPLNIDELNERLDRELIAARKVVEAADRMRTYGKIQCPACSIDDAPDGVPCYCFDYIEATGDLDKALAEYRQATEKK